MTYIGNTTFKHGNDLGVPPAATVVLSPGEDITSIFGNSGWFIRSLGFTTSWGTVYGPWGDPSETAFSIPGPVFGFYGAHWGNIFSSFGIWTTDPPSVPGPTPAPNPAGVFRSKMFGGLSVNDTRWDHGSTFAGNSLLLTRLLLHGCGGRPSITYVV